MKPPRELRLSDDWLWYVVKALHGMRESSKALQDVVRDMYVAYEWNLFQTAPCLAYSSRLDALSGWHGDDFHSEGEPETLDEVDAMILGTLKAKVLPRLGPGASAEGTILRRILKWSTEGVHLTPDAKHVENLASLLEVKRAKSSPTPCSRATCRGQRNVLEPLTASEATVFRRGTGIALYLGPDRFDLQFATKELAQDMQTPSKISMIRLRRMVRYPLGAADVGPFCAYQSEPSTVLAWTDGDWSGNAMTCKSTSAGAIQPGSHTIETWSVNQQVVSLSSAESEFYAIGSGCARGLTIKHVLLEILHTTTPDAEIGMTVCTDSDAARGMIHRVGCGRVRHLQTRYLWHQQALRESTFRRGSLWHERESEWPGYRGLGEGGDDTRCMNKLAIVPATTLRGAIVAVLAQ